MSKLAIESLNSKMLKFIFNYRVIIAYVMTMSYLCLHYYVSNKDLINESQNENSLNHQVIQNLDIIKKPRRLLLQNQDYVYVSKVYASSDKSIILNTLKRNQKLIVDKSLNGKKYKREFKTDDLKFDYTYSGNYNLKNKSTIYSSQILQDKILVHLLNTSYFSNLNASTNGIFVEAGAYDGETWSNTLYLERFQNWTGLLIEPSVENYQKLRNKNRNAYSINSCLCSGKTSVKSDFIEAGPFGITTNHTSANLVNSEPTYRVTCHPLAKILNQFISNYFFNKKSKISQESMIPTIDYMSLDIEGNEKNTIETFPWHKFRFNFLNIEFNQDKEIYTWLKSYLNQFGYVETIVDDVWFQDVYLAHISVYDKLNLSIKSVSEFIKFNS